MNGFKNLDCKECETKEQITNKLYRLLDKTEKFHWFLIDELEKEIQKLNKEITKQNNYIESLKNILKEKNLEEVKSKNE